MWYIIVSPIALSQGYRRLINDQSEKRLYEAEELVSCEDGSGGRRMRCDISFAYLSLVPHLLVVCSALIVSRHRIRVHSVGALYGQLRSA